MNAENFPKTLHEVIRHFDENTAHDFFVSLRWPEGVRCPRCDSARVSFIRTRKTWTCMDCTKKKQFSVKVGTIFEGSPIKLDKWFAAMWMLTNAKNGISSYEIHRAIGVTQKTAWFMMHRIRVAMQTGSFVKDKTAGLVEVDESYIGGHARFMHKDVKERKGIRQGHGSHAKTAVTAILDRHTKSYSRIVALEVGSKTPTLKDAEKLINKHVAKGAEIHTDESLLYRNLHETFVHEVVNHAESYVREGVIHTNGLENFWSLLKRGLRGTYVSVEPFHLFRYLSEQVFRFNERKDEDGDAGRFLKVVSNVFGKRLPYRKLIGDGDALPA